MFGRRRKRAPEAKFPLARITVGAVTHLGHLRPENEDHFAAYLPEDEEALAERGALLVVADGMGGHAAGALASQTAVDALLDEYYSMLLDRDLETALHDAYVAANRRVVAVSEARPEAAGMGTTLVSVAVHGAEFVAANVGDSRAYLFRGSKLTRLTTDHTLAQEILARNNGSELGLADAAAMSMGHQLTRCIGIDEDDAAPDLVRAALQAGDVLLLASDGLTGPVPDHEIAEVLRIERSPSVAGHMLVACALKAGGPDNVTALLARVDSLE